MEYINSYLYNLFDTHFIHFEFNSDALKEFFQIKNKDNIKRE